MADGFRYDAHHAAPPQRHDDARTGRDAGRQRVGDFVDVGAAYRNWEDDCGIGHRRRTPSPGSVGSRIWPRSIRERIVHRKRRAVQIGGIDERREMRGRGDAERSLDHAAHHDEHAVGAGGSDHAERFPQRSALGELDVDPVDATGEPRNIGGDETAFVHDDGQVVLGRHAPHLEQSVQIIRRERLLQKLDAVLLQDRDHLLGPCHGPARVGIHAQRLPRRLAHDTENLFVAVGAELHFQNGVVLGFTHFGPHLVRRIESNREGGQGSTFGIESPQPPQRLPQLFPNEIMQRRRERGAGRPVLRQRVLPAILRGFKVERIARHVRAEVLEAGEHRVERLAIERGWIGFAPSLLPVVIDESDPGALVPVGRATGDDEGVAGGDGALLDVQLHSQRFFLSHHMMTPEVNAITMRAP